MYSSQEYKPLHDLKCFVHGNGVPLTDKSGIYKFSGTSLGVYVSFFAKIWARNNNNTALSQDFERFF